MTESTATVPTIPGHTRPEMHEDLPDYMTEPHQVAKFHAEYLTRFPSLGVHFMAALVEAKELGLRVTDGGEILLPRTELELDAALRDAQQTWNRNRDRYLQAIADPASLEQDYQRRWVDAFAEGEGLPAIEWPA